MNMQLYGFINFKIPGWAAGDVSQQLGHLLFQRTWVVSQHPHDGSQPCIPPVPGIWHTLLVSMSTWCTNVLKYMKIIYILIYLLVAEEMAQWARALAAWVAEFGCQQYTHSHRYRQTDRQLCMVVTPVLWRADHHYGLLAASIPIGSMRGPISSKFGSEGWIKC